MFLREPVDGAKRYHRTDCRGRSITANNRQMRSAARTYTYTRENNRATMELVGQAHTSSVFQTLKSVSRHTSDTKLELVLLLLLLVAKTLLGH